MSPGENRPRVQAKGARWKNAALISIKAGNPSATSGQTDASCVATAPSTTTTPLTTSEIAPLCRQMENIASPISPIENELFEDVDAVCGKAEPPTFG